MSNETNKEENVEPREIDLEEQDGELLPDREAMSILDPTSGITGNLGPPVLDEP